MSGYVDELWEFLWLHPNLDFEMGYDRDHPLWQVFIRDWTQGDVLVLAEGETPVIAIQAALAKAKESVFS